MHSSLLKWHSTRLFTVLLLLLLSGCAMLSAQKKAQLQQLEMDANQTMAKIQVRLQETPESSLEDSLYVLNTILDYASGVQRDPKQFSSERMEEYNRKINIINANIDRFKDLTLQTDVSFPPGRYQLEDLSPAGQAACEQLVIKVAETVRDLQQQYADYPLRVTIKTIGYTDETPFLAGTSLIREMEAEITTLAPAGDARRSQYNQVLSQFRAKSLNNYFKVQLKQRLANIENINIIPKVVGLGENLPGTKSEPPYAERDARRRITIVSPFIEVML